MMSVVFESNSGSDGNRIQRPGFAHGMWIYNPSETGRFTGDDRRSSKLCGVGGEDSSSSSSIGNNSDASDGGGDSDEDDGEVQSSIRGPLNSLSALEEVFPSKKGISTFYTGKSKSYTSLADAASVQSIKEIVKPEDAYNRKRKNLLAHSVLLDKNRNNFTSNVGTSKRFADSNRSALGIGLKMKSHDSNKSGVSSNVNSSLPGLSLPPLPVHPRRLPANESLDSSPRLYCSPWRSLSLSDLQHAATATPSMTSPVSNKRGEDDD